MVGVSNHLDDASLQQFVNSKTNRPVVFSYSASIFEGKQLGILQIPPQERPLFLKKPFGKLASNTVYMRSGSSTSIANPDEIARMGKDNALQSQLPTLDLQFADVEQCVPIGCNLQTESTFLEIPEKDQLPAFGDANPFSVPMDKTDYYKQFAEYYQWVKILAPIRFILKNTGSSLAVNTRLKIKQPLEDGLLFCSDDDYPEKPEKYSEVLLPNIPNGFTRSHLIITEQKNNWEIEVMVGDVQPKDAVCSEVLYIVSGISRPIELMTQIYGDNIPEPPAVKLQIDIQVQKQSISVDELIAIADRFDESSS